jgi:5-methylcytosine-specific restriction endonuclease McrA
MQPPTAFKDRIADYADRWVAEMQDDESLEDYHGEDGEGYKFKAVGTFRREFHIEQRQLHEMLKNALADSVNLIHSGNYYPDTMLLHCAERAPGFVRKELRSLLKEKDPVEERIDGFIGRMNKRFKSRNKQLYFDYRFLSFFLSCHDPEKYFYVKFTEYRDYAARIGYSLEIRKTQPPGEKYLALSKLAEATRHVLADHKGFSALHRKLVAHYGYKDRSLSWGTYDFIYYVAHLASRRTVHDVAQIDRSRRAVKEQKSEEADEIIHLQRNQSKLADKNDDELLQDAKNYRPGKTDAKSATVRLRQDNALQKERIKKLERYHCQVCGATIKYRDERGELRRFIHADHIIPKAEGGTEHYLNLWALCPNCHAKKSFGVITIDPKRRLVKRNGKPVGIRDNHLGWYKRSPG